MNIDLEEMKKNAPKTASTSLLLVFLIFLTVSCYHHLTKENPYGLNIISDIQTYNRQVTLDSNSALVNIKNLIPDIVLDIRYASNDNFTHRRMYEAPEAYVRKSVAQALVKIQNELKDEGLGLKIYDAYRPYSVTLKFYEICPDTMFVAVPWKGSKHNRGCAVDVSLVDLKTGKELEMPTTFDDFSEKASQSYMALPAQVLQNRQILKDVMMKSGFIPLKEEWWHYDFLGWEKYHLMDISFHELKNK